MFVNFILPKSASPRTAGHRLISDTKLLRCSVWQIEFATGECKAPLLCYTRLGETQMLLDKQQRPQWSGRQRKNSISAMKTEEYIDRVTPS